MRFVRGLSIVVAGPDPTRLHAALSVAAAWAALDRPARIFLQSDSAGLLGRLDEPGSGEGQPSLREMLSESMALGVTVTLCQGGLALCGLSAEHLPDGVETGGLVGFLAEAGDDQLMMA
ncbi:MAG TPA: peroxiredoxin [Allosphingosinicella sp.]